LRWFVQADADTSKILHIRNNIELTCYNKPLIGVLKLQHDLLLHYGCEHNFCLTLYNFAQKRKAEQDSEPVKSSGDSLKPANSSNKRDSLAEGSDAKKTVKLLAPLPKPVRLTAEVNKFHLKNKIGLLEYSYTPYNDRCCIINGQFHFTAKKMFPENVIAAY